MNYIDTHFHLDLWSDPGKIIEEIEKSKIYTIAVTNAPSFYTHTYNFVKDKKYIKAALGFHPELVQSRFNEFSIFMELLDSTKYIGEIGIDGNKVNQESKKIQISIFEKIIEACSNYSNKVLTIHSRGAQKEVINIIGRNFLNKVILHWYSGSLKELERAIEYGFYFSVNISMTNSYKGKDIISHIPQNRILTESDGPFTKYRNKPCSPLMIFETVRSISIIHNIEYEVCKKMIFDNLNSVLTIGD
ncbi:MAG: Qat anti-phage system TatD family nuclease QatD [Ignavibacteriaceae bacterium]